MPSEYENKRLANIKRNQQILASLNIVPSKLSASLPFTQQIKRHAKVKKESSLGQSRNYASSENDGGVRKMSTRSFSKYASPSTIISNESPSEALNSTKQSKKEAQEQLVSLEMMKFKLDGINIVDSNKITSDADQLNANGLLTSSTSQIQELSYREKGDKDGNLSVLDINAIRECSDSSDSPTGIFRLKPSADTISTLKVHPTDPTKIFLSCYDGTLRMMDFTTQIFSVVHHLTNGDYLTSFDTNSTGNILYYSTGSGYVGIVDTRTSGGYSAAPASLSFAAVTPNAATKQIKLHEKKTQCVSVNWQFPAYFVTSSLDNTVCIWDERTLSNSNSSHDDQISLPIPTKKFTQRRSVTSAYFHRMNGNKLVTTCYDDYIRLYDDALSPSTTKPHSIIHHNNQTGKWITTFKAIWDNKNGQESYFLVGDMQKSVSIFSGNSGNILHKLHSENWLTAQPAVNAIHPVANLVASGTARGKIAIWC